MTGLHCYVSLLALTPSVSPLRNAIQHRLNHMWQLRFMACCSFTSAATTLRMVHYLLAFKRRTSLTRLFLLTSSFSGEDIVNPHENLYLSYLLSLRFPFFLAPKEPVAIRCIMRGKKCDSRTSQNGDKVSVLSGSHEIMDIFFFPLFGLHNSV